MQFFAAFALANEIDTWRKHHRGLFTTVNCLHLSRLSGITRERLEPRRLILSPLAERTHHSAIGVKQYGSSHERSGNLSPIAWAGVPLEAPSQLAGNHCTGHSDHQSR